MSKFFFRRAVRSFFIYLRLEIEVSCIGADGALFIKVTKYINNIKVDDKKKDYFIAFPTFVLV